MSQKTSFVHYFIKNSYVSYMILRSLTVVKVDVPIFMIILAENIKIIAQKVIEGNNNFKSFIKKLKNHKCIIYDTPVINGIAQLILNINPYIIICNLKQNN